METVKLYSSKRSNKDFLVLSAIGIIMVVGGHCGCRFLEFDSLLPYYEFHMPLFIFISGYFFNCSSRKTGEWFIHKCKGLIVPYYGNHFAFAIVAVYLYSTYGFKNLLETLSFRSLIIEPLIPSTLAGFNSASWFVIVLFYIEIINHVVYKFLKCKYADVIFFFFSLTIGIISIHFSMNDIWMISGHRNMVIMNIIRVTSLLPYYVFGCIYRKYIENRYRLISKVNIILILTFMLVIMNMVFPNLSSVDYKYCSFSYYLMTYLVGLGGILFWLQISKILSKEIGDSYIVNIIGNNTFSIMTYHLFGFFVINCICLMVNRFFSLGLDVGIFWEKPRNSIFSKEISSWIYLICSIAISLVIKLLLEYVKMIFRKTSLLFRGFLHSKLRNGSIE